MERLITLDGLFSPLFAEIGKVAPDIELPLICSLDDEVSITAHIFPGIDRIDICTADSTCNAPEWMERFRTEWEHDDFRKKFTPNLKKKRIAFHTSFPEWMPLRACSSLRRGRPLISLFLLRPMRCQAQNAGRPTTRIASRSTSDCRASPLERVFRRGNPGRQDSRG